jgi:hypothetical protein
MKNVTLMMCAALTSFLFSASALAVAASGNPNPGGRASNSSDEVSVPTADVCNCGTNNSLVQPTRGSTMPAGTMRAPVSVAGTTGNSGSARSAEPAPKK